MLARSSNLSPPLRSVKPLGTKSNTMAAITTPMTANQTKGVFQLASCDSIAPKRGPKNAPTPYATIIQPMKNDLLCWK